MMQIKINKSNPVLVIGSGVMGLTSAIRLQESGFTVRIVTRDLPPHTTSDAAAAYWFPEGEPYDRVQIWGRETYYALQKMTQIPEAGVSIQRYTRLLRQPNDPPACAAQVDDFQRLDQSAYSDEYPYGYSMSIPLLDTPVYMPYLLDRFLVHGGEIEQATIMNLADLTPDFPLMINCSGVWANQLAHDEQVYPIRGQVVRIRKPVGLGDGLFSLADDDVMTYIIPRSQDCLLGGTKQAGNWQLTPDLVTAEEIIDRCAAFNPILRNPDIIEHKVGLRPGRASIELSVQQLDPESAIIHNYGHGGNGHSLSWGCADEVATLAAKWIA